VNLPNALTLSRLAAIPVLMILLIARFGGHDQIAAAVFILVSFTDTLDGQIARRRGLVSDLGKFLDPLADKLFVLSVLIVLVQEGLVAAWIVVVIFSRELLITILRSVGATQGRIISAAPMGKTKTMTQMAAVVLLILQRPYPVLVPFAELAVGVAIIFTVGSGIDYMWRFRHVLWPAAGGTVSEEGLPAAHQKQAHRFSRRVMHRRPARSSHHRPARKLRVFHRRCHRVRGRGQACRARSACRPAPAARSREP
jgi:CDP-diacylglycerol--glycerol-3-phosphate 3-phosphatidyltransferase